MSITPKGISVLELYRQYRTQKLIVNRRYQRKLVWTKDEKARLIESLLLNYPIPLILLGVFNNGEGEEMYEIIDGMQRLNAIFGFIENEFSVSEKYFDVKKHPFAYELSQAGVFKPVDTSALFDSEICAKFLEYSLAVTIFRANSITEIEDIFNRINSNGKHLSAQEVRQAGVTTKFSGLVRSLAAEIRGDVSSEELPLTDMPEISIDAKSMDLGYGVLAEDTFWCKQGILRVSGLRDSEDEQLLADIILSIALNEPFAASKENFDSYYGKGDVDKSDKIELAIVTYGEDNLKKDIKTVLSHIKNSIKDVAASKAKDNNYLRSILSRKSGGSNPVKEPFYTLFMSFYELIIKESKEPFEYEKIFAAVSSLITKIKMSPTVKIENRIDNIGLTKGLIQNYFKHSNNPTRSSGSYAVDFENYLRRSKTEAANYDFKQGLYNLDSRSRSFDDKNLEKIIQNIAAMANLGKEKKGYIFIGVTDKEEDTKRIEDLDKITAPRFFSFGIVGLEREARLKSTSLDQYILSISRKIRDSKLPEWLKTAVNTNLTPITYMDHTVLMIEVKAGNEPAWYGDKLYIRDGHEKKPQEVSGGQISAVYSLFR